MEVRMKAREITEKVMNVIFVVCGLVSIVAVIGISAYMIISGLPAIRTIGFKEFIFGQVWKSTADPAQFGTLPFILSEEPTLFLEDSIFGNCDFLSCFLGASYGFIEFFVAFFFPLFLFYH